MSLIAYLNSDNIITISGLKDVTADTFINTATCAVTLYDSNDVEVSGETWPLTLNYVSASDGIYRATLADTLSVSAGEYTAIVTADDGAGQKRTFNISITYQNG
jgi:hypothetical protein